VNRETKLALILGLAVVLIVGVFMGEHFSKSRQPIPNINVGIGEDLAGGPALAPNIPGEPQLPAPMVQPDERVRPGVAGGPESSTPGAGRTPGASGLPGSGAVEAGDQPVGPGVQPPAVIPMIPGRSGGKTAMAGRVDETPGAGGSVEPLPAGPQGAAGGGGSVAGTGPGGLPISNGKELAHTVKSGDTLAKLTKQYYNSGEADLWSKLANYNKGKLGKNNGLSVGTTLRVPPLDVLLGKAELSQAGRGVFPPGTPGTPGVVLPGQGSRQANLEKITGPSGNGAADPTVRTYTVKSGDTLGSISKNELGTATRWKEILDLNKKLLPSPEAMKIGMTLKLPAKDAGKPVGDRASAPSGR
jgi:nucleoid-associated protein YgaU